MIIKSFDRWIFNHLNSKQVKVCYSVKFNILMFHIHISTVVYTWALSLGSKTGHPKTRHIWIPALHNSSIMSHEWLYHLTNDLVFKLSFENHNFLIRYLDTTQILDYSGGLNTKRVRYSNGRKSFCCWIVQISMVVAWNPNLFVRFVQFLNGLFGFQIV